MFIDWEDEVQSEYFSWLCSIVDADNPDNSHIQLMEHLFMIIFSEDSAKLVPNDDNRIKDGMNLRNDFADFSDFDDYSSLDGECSVLEMMIALSQRMADTMGFDDFVPLFWEMLHNLGLDVFNDDVRFHDRQHHRIERIIDILLKRKYDYDGNGGLFPLRNPDRDQRKIEIWYQMGAYLLENYM